MPLTQARIQYCTVWIQTSQPTFISSSVGVFSTRNISPSVSSTFDTHSVHSQAQQGQSFHQCLQQRTTTC